MGVKRRIRGIACSLARPIAARLPSPCHQTPQTLADTALGADVGSAGYEFHLVQRARQYGAVVQAAILMSVRHEPVLAIAKWEREQESS